MFATHFDAVNKVWSGPKTEIVVDEQESLGEFLLKKLNSDPEIVTQINGDTGETLTKSEIRIRSIRCAQNLTKLGCAQNDRIGIVARNHHNLTPLLIGAICIGTPICPFDVAIVKDGIDAILNRLRPSFIFCDADVLESVKDIIDDIGFTAQFFTVNGSVDGYESIDALTKETGEEESFVCTKINDAHSHAAVIACTSGSTGQPKSFCLNHKIFIMSLKDQFFQSALISFNFSSMYWVSSVYSMLGTVFKSKRLFTKQPFSPDIFFDFVEKYKIQSFLGPPSQMQAIVTSERCQSVDLSSLMICFLIGSTLPPTLVQALKKSIPKCIVLSAYGMTEGTFVSCTVPNELEEYPYSCGRLKFGTKVKIINQSTGESCGIGEDGEIYIKFPISSMGYYNDETANRNAYDSDGYFIPGDLGHFDETGRLYIIGRKKEIFKCHGFAIWPGELENIILKHPGIRDCSVVSVYDDEIVSELPAAVAIKKKDSSITEDDVYAIVADQLASYKRLDGGVFFVDKLPMTPSGKIVRSKVNELAQQFYQLKKTNN